MSSYAQTIFNSVNLLMGIGILSLPFAFRITGWVIGIAFLVLCCTMTHHTAGLLALCLDFPKYMAGLAARKATTTTNAATEYTPLVSFPPLTRRPPATYGDIGELAYGEHGRNFISVLFCLELAAASVALIILASDSVTALFPALNPLLVKIAALVITMPLTYPTSLSWASYGSLIGLIALANLMIIVVWDGTTTTESPGSLLVPAQTHMWPERWELVPLAIGLIMASFSGHAVFPNIYRDMKEPKKYNSMLNASYIITFTVCLMLASAGYLMFGDFTMPELTQNLPLVPSYNKVLTHMTLFLTAINPLTKYPLSVNPINVQIEHTLHLLFPSLIPSPPHSLLLRLPIRTCTSLLILLIAITFPNFHSLMSLTGSLFACAVCVVFPSLCYLKLYGPALGMRAKCLEWAIVGVGVVCGSVGTYWACFMDV
ncbi:transmembrane amino acid transporter protein-domain-containing protein [Phlyctochytrium arcticum]|nr:transmembrane amino acid transporter protein-domain-containing protein [Phlyctochytrium arcticum]